MSNREGCFSVGQARNDQGICRVRLDYDPRERPWYKDAERRDGSWLTGPYIFFATGKQGYTVQSVAENRAKAGVIAGDLLMDATQGGVEEGKN